ncbi:type II toxin-antitoxin system TacA family antitoxin [Botrimarina colliarenosi]|nr:DUF1778 domain-containing protein [Botrimarina colliarenosi]
MLENEEPKTARLEARLPESIHALLREAASLQGRSLSEFVVSSAREAAEQAIAQHEVIRLSLADQQRFAEQLLEPAPIAPALQRAAQHHHGLVEPS